MAKEKFNIQNPRIVPVYGKMKNPAIVSPKNSTKYPYNYNEETGEEEGVGATIYQNIVDLAYDYGVYEPENDAKSILESLNIWDHGYTTAYALNEAIRRSNLGYELEDEYGNLATGEFIAELFKALGHDGIIQDAHHFFHQMKGIRPGDKHYIFFHPSQLKSAIGNVGYYNPNSNVLTASKKGIFKKPDVH